MSAIEDRYRFLRSDVAELNRLIDMTPESAVIDRKSLEYRRDQVQAELDEFPVPQRWPATVHLTFNGKPVAEEEGIRADFAGKAVNAFGTVVTSLAAGQKGTLPEKGPIPNQDAYRLLVTSTARGSFGFELEENQSSQAAPTADESAVEIAIEQARNIMESLVHDDEVFAEAVAETDKRALDDIRDFLKLMADSDAVCTLTFKGTAFRFVDTGQVRRGLRKLAEDNVHEGQEEIIGQFEGILPQSRLAEFRLSGNGELLKCRIDHTLTRVEDIRDNLNRELRAKAKYRQVGTSRRHYTILDFETFPK